MYQPQQNSSKMQIHPYHSESCLLRMFNNDMSVVVTTVLSSNRQVPTGQISSK